MRLTRARHEEVSAAGPLDLPSVLMDTNRHSVREGGSDSETRTQAKTSPKTGNAQHHAVDDEDDGHHLQKGQQMFEAESLYDWQGKDVIDAVGGTIGSFDTIYVDEETATPSFVSIKLAGLSRRRIVLVPLSGVTVAPDYIRVPFDKSAVKRGPSIGAGVELTAYDERRLFEHYGMTYKGMTCHRVRHDGETVTARRLLRRSTPLK